MKVDYSDATVASRYSAARELSREVLERWEAVVRPYIRGRPSPRILDLGAGTGIFTRAWSRWVAGSVVALEPSAAMRAELCADRVPDGVDVVAGRGEMLPIRSQSLDVVWLSAVLHHLSDQRACVAELRRVVRPGGVVFVRGLFADRHPIVALQFLPGEARARSRFPFSMATAELFGDGGFDCVAVQDVEDAGPSTVGEAMERIEAMRGADSLLAQFTDEEVAAGLATMHAMDPATPLSPSPLGLMVFVPSSKDPT